MGSVESVVILQTPRSEFLPKFFEFCFWTILNGLLFYFAYGFTNHRTLSEESLFRAYFGTELAIPLLPFMIVIYFSFNLLTGTSLFVLNRLELRAFAWSSMICTLAAAFFFYFFPTICGFERPTLEEVGIWRPWFEFLYSFDQPQNLVPSLHVTYSALAVYVMTPRVRPMGRKILASWLVLLCASVLFTHQHHVLDIAGGLLLGYAVFRWGFQPILRQIEIKSS